MTDASYWARQARRYDRAALALNRRMPDVARAVADALGGAGDVLEVAAGTGMITRQAAPAPRRYVATDATPGMLEVLSARLGALPHVEVRVADALALEFPDATFDAVVMANLVHLLPEPTAALAEARRVLRPEGRLVVPTFCHGEGPVARAVSRMLAATGFPVVTRFRRAELEALVGSAGFAVTDARWFPGLLPIRFVVALRC